MDEYNQEALNEGGEVTTPDTTPVSETETAEEVNETEVDETPTGESETEGSETETDEDIKKRDANSRIRELNAKAKAERDRADSLAKKLEELTGSGEPQDYNSPYTPQIEPGAEISPDQYKQDVMRTADSLVNIRLKQQEAVGRIRSESQEVIRQFPELDPESESFNKDLSDSITEATEAYVSRNPYSASVKTFVTKLMKPYKEALSRDVGKATENIAKQVSQAALKPTVQRVESKSLEEKSIQELEKELGIVQG